MYQINGFSNDLPKIISEFWNKQINQNEFKNIKKLVKVITKLCYIYEKTKSFFNNNILDSYNFLTLKFSNIDIGKLEVIQKNILRESINETNQFFYENEKNEDSWKMIFSLISCDLSCSSIFLQGAPGSGKSAAARHYGSFRKFHNRIPILSISCNSDLTFDYFVGNYSLKNSEFNFIEGPLLIAIKNG